MRRHPDTASTTHPNMLEALIKLLIGRGAHVVVGDSPGGPFTEYLLRSVYDGSNITRLEKLGATLNYDTGVETVACNGKTISRIEIARFVREADAVITFAKLKTHMFMGYSGAVKNLFGVVPGTVKVDYHQRFTEKSDFAGMIVDVAESVAPRLSLIDAVVGMEGPGPTGGSPRPIGALIVSTDAHAADLIGSSLIGLKPCDVPTLAEAIARGLCPPSVGDIEVLGDSVASLAVPDFKIIQPDIPLAINIRMLNTKLVRRIFQTRPVVDKAVCVGCGECKRACPPKAIALIDKKPVFDRAKCIRCFCCQELCPKTAISVQRTWLARAVEKFGK